MGARRFVATYVRFQQRRCTVRRATASLLCSMTERPGGRIPLLPLGDRASPRAIAARCGRLLLQAVVVKHAANTLWCDPASLRTVEPRCVPSAAHRVESGSVSGSSNRMCHRGIAMPLAGSDAFDHVLCTAGEREGRGRGRVRRRSARPPASERGPYGACLSFASHRCATRPALPVTSLVLAAQALRSG